MTNLIVGCREIELLCRQRAISDRARSWKWQAEADRWSDLAHREIASRFQNNEMHAGPMAKPSGAFQVDGKQIQHEAERGSSRFLQVC
jgi:hypothetical protein